MRRYTFWQRIRRLTRYRLLIPVKRNMHPPVYTARGVMIGLGWAMTPLVGVQLILVLATWVAARALFRWDFSLVVALAWTWVSNVATMIPFYYVWYVTGQFLRGRWDDLSGYDAFAGLLARTWDPDATLTQMVGTYVAIAASEWGLSMMVGCLPFVVIVSWLSYRWSLALVTKHRVRRMKPRVGPRDEG